MDDQRFNQVASGTASMKDVASPPALADITLEYGMWLLIQPTYASAAFPQGCVSFPAVYPRV